MTSEQQGNQSMKGSPTRISQGSQTPKKRKPRSTRKTRGFSKESTIQPPSVPPPINTPRATSTADSHYSASMYN